MLGWLFKETVKEKPIIKEKSIIDIELEKKKQKRTEMCMIGASFMQQASRIDNNGFLCDNFNELMNLIRSNFKELDEPFFIDSYDYDTLKFENAPREPSPRQYKSGKLRGEVHGAGNGMFISGHTRGDWVEHDFNDPEYRKAQKEYKEEIKKLQEYKGLVDYWGIKFLPSHNLSSNQRSQILTNTAKYFFNGGKDIDSITTPVKDERTEKLRKLIIEKFYNIKDKK